MTPAARATWAAAAFIAVPLLAGGCIAGERPAHGDVIVIENVADTVVSTRSGLIGAVADLAIADDGSLFLVDEQASMVHVLDSSGGFVRSIGRAGGGPGELGGPRAISLSGDTLLVFEAGNRRVQALSSLGEPLRSSPLPPESPTYFPALRPDGAFVAATLGLDSTLAKVFLPGSAPVSLGKPVGAVGNVVRMSALKDEIERGAIPSIFLNNVEPIWVGEAVWLVASARATLERYSVLGERLDSIHVTEPEMAAMLEDFHANNRNLPENEVFPLRYFSDARGVDGELWVLLGSSRDGPATLLIAAGEGDPTRRLEVPKVVGATGFTVDRVRGQLYLVIGGTAEILRVRLPER